jgi:hypothetical protein
LPVFFNSPEIVFHSNSQFLFIMLILSFSPIAPPDHQIKTNITGQGTEP